MDTQNKMPVNDDFLVPCPQCAFKHLSAAFAYALDSGFERDRATRMDEDCQTGPLVPIGAVTYRLDVLAAMAFINLVEIEEGYLSHIPYAVGLMSQLEERLVALGTEEGSERARRARKVRVGLMASLDTVPALCRDFRPVLNSCRPCSFVRAHMVEARREFPGLESDPDLSFNLDAAPVSDIRARLLAAITRLQADFFDLPRNTIGKEVNEDGSKDSQEGGPGEGGGQEGPRQEGGPGGLQGRQG